MSARNASAGPLPPNARIDAARRYLEGTDLSLREIAKRCGFDSTDALRRAFARRLQINPADYRARFRTQRTTGISPQRPTNSDTLAKRVARGR